MNCVLDEFEKREFFLKRKWKTKNLFPWSQDFTEYCWAIAVLGGCKNSCVYGK